MPTILYTLDPSLQSNTSIGAPGSSTGVGGTVIDKAGAWNFNSGLLHFTPTTGGSSFLTNHLYLPLTVQNKNPCQITRQRITLESTTSIGVCVYYDGNGSTGKWYQYNIAIGASPILNFFKVVSSVVTTPTVNDIIGTFSGTTPLIGETWDFELEIIQIASVNTMYVRAYKLVLGVPVLQYEGIVTDSSSPIAVGVGMVLGNSTTSDVGLLTFSSYPTFAETTGTGTSTSDPFTIFIPTSISNGTTAPLMVFSHGATGNEHQVETFPYFIAKCMDAGFRLIAGLFTGDHWANPSGQAALIDDIATFSSTHTSTDLCLFGASMGGDLVNMVMINATTTKIVAGLNLRANCSCSSVCDPVFTHDNGSSFTSSINAAFPSYPTGVAACNPKALMQANATKQNHIPYMAIYTLDDAVIPPANNIIPFVAAMTDGPTPIVITAATGGHVGQVLLTSPIMDQVFNFFANPPIYIPMGQPNVGGRNYGPGGVGVGER